MITGPNVGASVVAPVLTVLIVVFVVSLVAMGLR